MSVTKRISGDYNIVNKANGLTTGNVTITTDTLFVNGNMLVGGTSTTVEKTDSYITDNIITLNKGETGAGVTLIYSGIEVDRGLSANVALRWNESTDKWEITTDGTTYSAIATSSGGTVIANVYADSAPMLSSNINLYGHTIYDSTVGTSANISLGTANGGATGVYVGNGTINNKELISKAKALIYTVLL